MGWQVFGCLGAVVVVDWLVCFVWQLNSLCLLVDKGTGGCLAGLVAVQPDSFLYEKSDWMFGLINIASDWPLCGVGTRLFLLLVHGNRSDLSLVQRED